jgi:hypothetical protein
MCSLERKIMLEAACPIKLMRLPAFYFKVSLLMSNAKYITDKYSKILAVLRVFCILSSFYSMKSSIKL